MTARYTTSHGATHKHYLIGFVHYINAETDEQALACANIRFNKVGKTVTLFDLFRLRKDGIKYSWTRCAKEREYTS